MTQYSRANATNAALPDEDSDEAPVPAQRTQHLAFHRRVHNDNDNDDYEASIAKFAAHDDPFADDDVANGHYGAGEFDIVPEEFGYIGQDMDLYDDDEEYGNDSYDGDCDNEEGKGHEGINGNDMDEEDEEACGHDDLHDDDSRNGSEHTINDSDGKNYMLFQK